MRTTLSIILVAALASSVFAAKRPYVGSSITTKSYSTPSKTASPKATEDEKRIAEEKNFDVSKISERLKNGAKK